MEEYITKLTADYPHIKYSTEEGENINKNAESLGIR